MGSATRTSAVNRRVSTVHVKSRTRMDEPSRKSCAVGNLSGSRGEGPSRVSTISADSRSNLTMLPAQAHRRFPPL